MNKSEPFDKKSNNLVMCLHNVDYVMSDIKSELHPFELAINHAHKFSPVPVSDDDLSCSKTYFYSTGEDDKTYIVPCRPVKIENDHFLKSFGLGDSCLKCEIVGKAKARFSITCPNGLKTQYFTIFKTDLGDNMPRELASDEEIETFIKATLSEIINDGFVVRTFAKPSPLRIGIGKVFVLPEKPKQDKDKPAIFS